MTQIEFENQLREMRQEKGREVANIAKLQSEVKAEIARLQSQYDGIKDRLHRLQQEREMYGLKRMAVEKEWKERIAKFQKDNFTTTRALENVSDWALINELKARGFRGHVDHADKPADFMENLNAKLNNADDE